MARVKRYRDLVEAEGKEFLGAEIKKLQRRCHDLELRIKDLEDERIQSNNREDINAGIKESSKGKQKQLSANNS